MRIDILTLFPEVCAAFTDASIVGRAQKSGAVEIHYHNIRDYSDDKHNRVDDYTYGGGAGMIIRPEPIFACFEAVCEQCGHKPRLLYMSPKGKVFNQAKAFELSKLPDMAILCGHYEGVDQRVLDMLVDEEISIGDYVLTGGEAAAVVVTDACVRLLDGVLASEECYLQESHTDGLLEYPQYTRPEVWRGIGVPQVLLSGHHANIEKWRREQAVDLTKKLRPDIMK